MSCVLAFFLFFGVEVIIRGGELCEEQWRERVEPYSPLPFKKDEREVRSQG